MSEIQITVGEDQDIELDEINIGVADGVVAFDVSGRILGLDETTLSKVAGERLIPVELVLKTADAPPDSEDSGRS